METRAKINKTKSRIFEKINKMLQSSRKKKKTQINKIRNEIREVTADNTEIQRIIKDYYEQLYANKMDNLEEMDKHLEKYTLPKMTRKK